jgi:hypothetical protein
MNTQYAQYLQWIGVGCTAVVGLCLVVMALLQSRPRRIRSWALVAVAVLEAAAAYLLISTPSITLSVVWMAVLGVVGLILGWFTGRMTKTASKDGRVYARVSPIAPWVVAVAYTAAVAALFFGSVALFSAMAVLVVFAAALMLSQSVSAALVIASATSAKPAKQPAEASAGPANG